MTFFIMEGNFSIQDVLKNDTFHPLIKIPMPEEVNDSTTSGSPGN